MPSGLAEFSHPRPRPGPREGSEPVTSERRSRRTGGWAWPAPGSRSVRPVRSDNARDRASPARDTIPVPPPVTFRPCNQLIAIHVASSIWSVMDLSNSNRLRSTFLRQPPGGRESARIPGARRVSLGVGLLAVGEGANCSEHLPTVTIPLYGHRARFLERESRTWRTVG